MQAEAPGYAGGANHESLYDYQQRVGLRRAPVGVELLEGYRRTADWRPLKATEARAELPEPRIEYGDSAIYYWRRSSDAT